MPSDPYYRSQQWRELRTQALKRDRYRCIIPGCASTHRLTVDHIISRRKGGPDTLANVRTLCIGHDSQMKEDATGSRRNNGQRLPY